MQELQEKLPGLWIQNELGDGENGEHWEFDGQHLTGYAFIIKENDTLITEYLKITNLEQEIAYLAHPVTQAPTAFWLKQPITAENNGRNFLFENPEHDFPTAILYQFVANDRINISIYSGERAMSYTLKRAKKP